MIELLRTKLFIPRPRKNLVARPRLVDCLNEGLDKKLTLIAAPAGFGKTTLLSEWIPQSPRCVTWLSLEAEDNDPARFWAYFIASLQSLSPRLGENALALLQSSQTPPLPSILTVLINEIGAFEPAFAIVLDDYHTIESQSIHQSLTFFLEHLPGNMQVLMTTRVDPPFPVARLRARNQLTEIRAHDLRFSADEAAAFLTQVMGLELSTEQVTMLEARTEGWIAGLQIAALSMQGRDDVSEFVRMFSGSHRHVLGYLADEVLNRLPKQVLDFLLYTSILDQLCGPLCDAVTGGEDGQAVLESLEHSNMFILPMDQEGKWFRYHHLFAEVLQGRLKGTQPERLPELHQRASQWLETSGRPAEAIDHAISGKDFPRAARLIADIIQSYNNRGVGTTLIRWIDQLPEELVFENVDLFSHKGWLLYLAGRVDEAKAHADKARTHITVDTPPAARGRLAYLDSQLAIAKGDMSAVQAYALEAIEMIGEEDVFFRILALMTVASVQTMTGNTKDAIGHLREAAQIGERSGQPFPTLTAYAKLANQLNLQGSLQEARGICQHARSLYQDSSGQPALISSIAFVEAAKLAYEEDDMDALEQYLRVATKLEETLSIPGLSFEINYVQTRFEGAKGNLESALDLARRGRANAEQMGLKGYIAVFTALEADLLLRLREVTALKKWIASAGSTFARCDELLNMYGSIVYARFLLDQKQLGDAAALIARMEEAARQSNYVRPLLTLLSLKSLLYRWQDDSEQAHLSLQEALHLAMPQKYRRVFIDEGEPMRALLLDYQSIVKQRGGTMDQRETIEAVAYLDRLLAAFPSQMDPGAAGHGMLPEPLSERELAILRLIATGRSNQEIAEILVIAISTVKSHINNLYGKLGTNRRTEAIAIAREQGLLAD
ncbi:MAG TPA: LuxR C-terminal-related transcriptional regulator [Anaerolineales bacterium]|nr:LuxR C-terminal-related transcriptional regulator [Anaerolineales bacterium]